MKRFFVLIFEFEWWKIKIVLRVRGEIGEIEKKEKFTITHP